MPDSLQNIKALPGAPALQNDSTAAADSLAASAGPLQGVVLVDVARPMPVGHRPDNGNALSWVVIGLMLIFCFVGVRYKSNQRFMKTLLRDLVEVRERHNAFDDTVRETSYLFFLRLLTACSAGVLLYTAASLSGAFAGAPAIAAMGACIAASVIYAILMPVLYAVTGAVFGSEKMRVEWMRGDAAGMALLAFPLFPAALVALCYQPAALWVVSASAAIFLVVKLMFVFKGFRIFISRSSSWVVFLYYLCNLEIVPLIITYMAALWLWIYMC